MEELKKKINDAHNAKKIREAFQKAYSYLNGDEDNDGAFSLIRNAQKEISSCGEAYKDVELKFGEILASLDDASSSVRQSIKDNEALDINLDAVEDRLDLIRRLTLKYGGSEQSATEYLSLASQKLEQIKMSDEEIKKLSLELDKSTERLIELGDKLTFSRNNAASDFSKSVTDILKFLDMPNVQFEVKISKGRYTKHGCDEVEFMIGTNAGEEVKPLSKIASGGELSRVMLAIKSVIAGYDDVDTLIFDEIDSGISYSFSSNCCKCK